MKYQFSDERLIVNIKKKTVETAFEAAIEERGAAWIPEADFS
jgi:hypothetical protein